MSPLDILLEVCLHHFINTGNHLKSGIYAKRWARKWKNGMTFVNVLMWIINFFYPKNFSTLEFVSDPNFFQAKFFGPLVFLTQNELQ